MKKTLLSTTLVVLSFTCLLTSCDRDDDKTVLPEEAATMDNHMGMGESDDIVSIVEDFMGTNSANMRVSHETQTVAGPCGSTAEITKNADGSGGNIVIDFGVGTTCEGRTRKGKIMIDYTGTYRSGNSTQLITFDNYYVNDNKIEGRKTLTSTVQGSGNTVTFVTHIKAEGFIITFQDGKTIQWSSERVRTYDPKGTITDSDDEVSISGTATGINRRGIAYAAVIITPLLLKCSCVASSGWIPVSGVLTVTPSDDQTERIVNYGTGDCDRIISITANGNSRTVTVR